MKIIASAASIFLVVMALDAKVIGDTSAQTLINNNLSPIVETLQNASALVQMLTSEIAAGNLSGQALTNFSEQLAALIINLADQFLQMAAESTGMLQTFLINMAFKLKQMAQLLKAQDANTIPQDILMKIVNSFLSLLAQTRIVVETFQGSAQNASLQEIARTTLGQVETLTTKLQTQVQEAVAN